MNQVLVHNYINGSGPKKGCGRPHHFLYAAVPAGEGTESQRNQGKQGLSQNLCTLKSRLEIFLTGSFPQAGISRLLLHFTNSLQMIPS